MIKFEYSDVMGWEHAIRGMRNPMNSWHKSDSEIKYENIRDSEGRMIIGPNDHKLMMQLRNAGSDHRKFMRMIIVYVDITAPLYWWKEFDTYKVGTVANSCSTMHKIHAGDLTIEDFSTEHLYLDSKEMLEKTIKGLNEYRNDFVVGKELGDSDAKNCWWQMIQLLPTSYNQRRTVMMNYEVLMNAYHARKYHKLDEWHNFCRWVETLPYSELITCPEEKETSFREDLEFFVNDCTKAQLKDLYEKIGERLKEESNE